MTMIIKNLTAAAFGGLKDWQSPPLSSGLVVFVGRNEAGKSTLFQLVATLLYGFSPASRASNPFSPWDGTAADIRGSLTTGDGREIEVQRKLRSHPEGWQVSGGVSLQIANNPINAVTFLPREIFSEVFALNLDSLHFPDAATWQQMQDRLLGGQWLSALRPVSRVATELEAEGADLWRPNQRGNSQSKQLKARLQDLRGQMEAVEQQEEHLHRQEAELDERDRQLRQVLIDKTTRMAALDRAERLLPVVKKLRRIDELKALANDLGPFEEIPEDPEAALLEMEKRRQELIEQRWQLLEQKGEAERQVRSFTDDEQVRCRQADAIRNMAAAGKQLDADREQIKLLALEIERQTGQLTDRSRDLLTGGWKPELSTALGEIDEAVLRVGINAYQKVDRLCDQQEARLAGLLARQGEMRAPKAAPWVAALLVLLGMTGVLAAGGRAPVGFAAALLAVLGVWLLVTAWLKGHGRSVADLVEARSALESLQNERCKDEQAVSRVLQALPVVPSLLQAPQESLLVDISRLRDLAAGLLESAGQRNCLQQSLAVKESEIRDLLVLCRWPAGVSLEESLREMDQSLNLAQGHSLAAAAAREVLAGLAGRLTTLEKEIAEAEAGRRNLLGKLGQLPGDNLEGRIFTLSERRQAEQQAQALLADLELDCPLAEARSEIAAAEAGGATWVRDDYQIAALKTEIDQDADAIIALNKEISTLKNELKHRPPTSLDDLTGEISAIQGEFQQVADRRDRLLLLKNILLEADRSFREEHQPDVLQKAGAYLALITGGRYTRLYLQESDIRGLQVRTPERDDLLDVGEGLSRGTLEQIYLALRLALVDHLDAGTDHLPLFLDEVLVNWDGIRLENGLALLSRIAGERQVFLFTCHPWMLENISGLPGVQLVEMDTAGML
jgi:hypothetical protein